jgi:transposase
MLHAGLDLSRRKIDVCLVSESGEHVDELDAPPDADALRTLARRIDEVFGEPVCAVIESMTGARLVHDTLEQEGYWPSTNLQLYGMTATGQSFGSSP